MKYQLLVIELFSVFAILAILYVAYLPIRNDDDFFQTEVIEFLPMDNWRCMRV